RRPEKPHTRNKKGTRARLYPRGGSLPKTPQGRPRECSMIIQLSEKELLGWLKLRELLYKRADPAHIFLSWCADRLERLGKESPNADFLQRLRQDAQLLADIRELLS